MSTDPGVRGEIFHEDARHLGEVRAAPGPGDVLVLGPAEHGVQSVAHLVEQIVGQRGIQQRGHGSPRRRQRQHEHNYGVLIGSKRMGCHKSVMNIYIRTRCLLITFVFNYQICCIREIRNGHLFRIIPESTANHFYASLA